MIKIIIPVLMLGMLSACGTNRLDDYSAGRLTRNELVLVETKNDGLVDWLIDELLFGWISPNTDVEIIVKIQTVDGIRTGIDFIRDSQKFAIEPGNHEFGMHCQVKITRDKEAEVYEYSDKINLNLAVGYKYSISAVKDGTACRFNIVETQV